MSASATGTSSGRTLISEGYATGAVTLTNLSDREVKVPFGTQFGSIKDPSLQFATQQEVSLQAGVGKQVEVKIKAISPGTMGNTEPGQLTIVPGDLNGIVLATNSEPTLGGTDLSAVSPTERDIQQIRDGVLEQLTQEAIGQFAYELGEGESMIDESLSVDEIISEDLSPAAGVPADQFTVTLEVRLSILVYEQSDLDLLGKMVLDANIPVGWMAKPESFYISQSSQASVNQGGQVVWNITVAQILHSEVNVNSIRINLAGKSRADALAYLETNLELREDPNITYAPTFWPSIPLLPFQIGIELK